MSLRGIIESTIQLFLDSYPLAATTKEPRHLSRTLAEDCRRHYAPLDFICSQGHPSDPDGFSLSNSAYEAHLAKELQLLESIRIDVLDTCIKAEQLKAWVWCQHWTKVVGREDEMVQECVWMLDFTGDEGNIRCARQFLDTVAVQKFMALAE